MTLLLVALLGTVSYSLFNDDVDDARFEATRQKMETLRTAILGKDTTDTTGQRNSFGFHGDLGRLPPTLADLVTQGTQPAWSFHTYYGFGIGWRGPYLDTGLTGGTPLAQDAWGRTFVYSTSANPPHLTSLGADGKAGGTGYDTDLVTQFSFNQRYAQVRGIAAMSDVRLSGQSVQIRYPSTKATMTYDIRISDANGYFTFSSVPFGPRAIFVGGPLPGMAPIPLVVDQDNEEVPVGLLNFGQTVKYVPGTSNSTGAGDAYVQAQLSSSHPQTLQLAAATISWVNAGSSPGFVYEITLNGDSESFTPVASGTRTVFTTPLVIPSRANGVNLELRMSQNADGTGTFDTDNYFFTLVLEWKGLTKADTIYFRVN